MKFIGGVGGREGGGVGVGGGWEAEGGQHHPQGGKHKGSPTVAKSRTPYLKSHLKSLKSLKFQNLKSRKVETVISKFLYISLPIMLKQGGQYQTSS